MEEEAVSCKTTHTVYSFTERDIVIKIINRVSVSCSDDIALESDLEKLTSMLLLLSLTVRPCPVLDRVGRSADLPPFVSVLPCALLYSALLHISLYYIPPPQFLSSSAPFPFHWRLICFPHSTFWFSYHYMP